VNIGFGTKDYQMRHIEFPKSKPFCPKLQVKFLHKNHAFSALHNYFVGFFQMPFCCGEYGTLICCWTQIHSKMHQFFWKYIYFNLHVCFVLHRHIVFFEFSNIYHLVLKDRKCVFSKNVTKYHVPPWII
jgi:hypothetical protein